MGRFSCLWGGRVAEEGALGRGRKKARRDSLAWTWGGVLLPEVFPESIGLVMGISGMFMGLLLRPRFALF